MGYNLYIGEAHADISLEDRWSQISVKAQSLDDAPQTSAPWEDHSNACFPSYTAWSNFCQQTGLTTVFYDDYDGILASHPGCVALTEDHYNCFAAAKATWGAKPANKRLMANGDDSDGIDYHQRRLDWLVWWTRWALDNCEYPSFANS